MPALDSTLGAVELGIVLSSILYGVTTMQAYIYTQTGKKDRFSLRLLVAWVWGFETLHEVIIIILLYDWTVTNYGNPAALRKVPWHLAISVPIQGFSGLAVQAFFSYRVFVLSQKVWLAIPAWLLCFVRTGTVIAIAVTAIKTGDLLEFEEKFTWLVSTSLILSTVVDLWNMAFLCYYLSQRRTSFKKTAKMINKMMLFSVETGIITSTTAVALTVSLFAMPHNFVWLSILMIYAKLFSNSLFVSLNGRVLAEAELNSTMASHLSSSPALRTTVQDRSIHLELSRLEQNGLGRAHSQTPDDGLMDLTFKRDI